ncbi:hypothetical protein KIPE111705_31525 [Kibdelosporangium persicum]|uniref:Uncharacterized protein n=1 Tax=Kibdelosporangium persicum TaxID=2698649 RepID=A0ABX2EV23_9PSEU|nr:hypothetical protein [Kibdelosporangium persicum]NRN62886.1 hypothetical protein [Kibdelosporangium persicum]
MNAVSFGYKATWLAVRDRPADVVADALRMPERGTVGWQDGVEAAYQGSVLLTPPVDGWTLVLSRPGPILPDPSADGFGEWFAKVSVELGTVRSFVTHRVVEIHGWARADQGRVERVYCYLGESGEVTTDVGPRTDEELELGIGDRDGIPTEEDVIRLAGLCSVNPAELDGRDVPGDCLLVPASRPKSRWRPGRLRR